MVTNIRIVKCQKIKKGAKMKNTVYSTKTENMEIKIKRKFVKVQMNNKEVNFQMDTNSDVTLINKWQTNRMKGGKIAQGIVMPCVIFFPS